MRVIAVASVDEAYALKDTLPDGFLKAKENASPNRRKSFLGDRALLQLMLKQFFGIETLPGILVAEHGKPYFKDRSLPFFNITHSASTIAIAVSDEEPQGIDLEYLKKRHDLKGLESRVMGESERRYVVKRGRKDELRLFTLHWTMRECLLKTSGIGLAGLSGITVTPPYEVAIPDVAPGFAHALRLDRVTKSSPAFLTYYTGGPQPVFYALKNAELLKLKAPRLIKTFCVNQPA